MMTNKQVETRTDLSEVRVGAVTLCVWVGDHHLHTWQQLQTPVDSLSVAPSHTSDHKQNVVAAKFRVCSSAKLTHLISSLWHWFTHWRPMFYTSSSAIAKRLRDASCLSVVSFNSTKCWAESFIVSHVGYRFITACN